MEIKHNKLGEHLKNGELTIKDLIRLNLKTINGRIYLNFGLNPHHSYKYNNYDDAENDKEILLDKFGALE